MNFFQRLSYLKKWHDDNHAIYLENRKIHKTAFDKKYKHELKKYIAESKKIKKRRETALIKESQISYHDWIERHFQKLLQKLSQTIVDFQKAELLEQFEVWQNDFAVLDYKFRTYTIELYFKVEIARFNSQFDSYLKALKEGHTDWLLNEDEKYTFWMDNHPLYKELQELEFQYDNLEDDESFYQNYAFNKNRIINKSYKQMYIPSTKENLDNPLERPSTVSEHLPIFF